MDHPPGLAGYILAKTAQDAVSLLCCKGVFLALVRLAAHLDHQVVLCRAAS